MRTRTLPLALAAFLVASAASCGGGSEAGASTRVAFVTNGVDPFWTYAAAGAKDAGAEFGVDVVVHMPPTGALSEQKQILEDLLAANIDGIAVSPIDGSNLADLINEAASRTNVITHDSDAPGTDRLCFIGVDNYAAGRDTGELVKQALPDGGSVMIFIGRLEQHNAVLRRQGVIDELLDREWNPENFDPPGQELVGDKYTVLDTRTDSFDNTKAKSNAEDAIARYPDLGAMVGLFAYNPPACLEALSNAGKLGEVAVIGFDEQDGTLQGIADGHVTGTISQQPYQYGYESVRILAGLASGDRAVLPDGGYLEVGVKVVGADEVEAFRARCQELLEKGK